MSGQPINDAMQWAGLGDASQLMHLVNNLRLDISPCYFTTSYVGIPLLTQ